MFLLVSCYFRFGVLFSLQHLFFDLIYRVFYGHNFVRHISIGSDDMSEVDARVTVFGSDKAIHFLEVRLHFKGSGGHTKSIVKVS